MSKIFSLKSGIYFSHIIKATYKSHYKQFFNQGNVLSNNNMNIYIALRPGIKVLKGQAIFLGYLDNS